MNNLLRLSNIQALLPGFVMLAVPAGAPAQATMMGPRMGSPGMARPAGSAAVAQPSRMSPMMAPAMQPMSAGGGRPSGMGYGSYGSGMGYGSYGTAPYDTQAYGAAGGSSDAQMYGSEGQPSPGEKSTRSLLTASGVPNDKGQLRWPIGLAILAAPGADELCEQIDGPFAEAARQAAGGPVNAALAEEMRQAVNKLRRLLLKEKAERFGMPLAVYQESERFLDKLDRAEQRLQTGMGTPAGQRPLTQGSSTSDSAGCHD
jgi:hypothetical protein